MAVKEFVLLLLFLVDLNTVDCRSFNGTAKVGRKERCRHVVRKEAQKYAQRVQALTDMVLALQREVHFMKDRRRKEISEMESLKVELSSQKALLTAAVDDWKRSQEDKWRPMESRNFPADCDEIYQQGGMRFPGTYEMMIRLSNDSTPFHVLCEPINNAGWIVIQARVDGSENFRRNWEDYKNGFGRFQSEFWLGNERIHQISSKGLTTLRVELEEFSGKKHWAEYSQFSVANESSNYAVTIGGYQGNAGDALQATNGQPFSTYDRDHDSRHTDNCAHLYAAGWWYYTCNTSNVNARYLKESTHSHFMYKHGIVWPTIHPYKTLKSTRLLLKPSAGRK